MERESTISDKIDGVLFGLPFDDRIRGWELIEQLIEERINEANTNTISCSHNFIQKDSQWKSCTHCGYIAPLNQN